MMLHFAFAHYGTYSAEGGLFSAEDNLRFTAAGPRRRQELLTSRTILRDLSHVAGLPEWRGLKAGCDGSPQLIGAHGLSVSLAHAGDWALAAISDRGRVGVDLEPIGTVFDQPALLRRMCSPDEHAALRLISPPPLRREETAHLWTAKEAILKAKGSGLSVDPRRVPAPLDRVYRPSSTPSGYAAAVVVLPPTTHVQARGP